MKRLSFLWVLAALFAISTIANAQFKFGVKLGGNIANATFSKDVLDTKNITGFQFGPMVEGMFGRGGIGFDMALLYSGKGFKVEKEKVQNDFLEVPLNLKFKLGIPLLNPYVSFGPYASFRINGDESLTLKESASGVIEQVKTKSFGAGMNFTAGAEIFSHLQLGLTYGWGLTDNYSAFEANDFKSYMGKAHTWQITAAFLFKAGKGK